MVAKETESLARKFKFCSGKDEDPHYEIDVAWRWRDGHVEMNATRVSVEDFNGFSLFLYLLAYLYGRNVAFDGDSDWHWFDGDSDAIWSMLCLPERYKNEDIAYVNVMDIRYVVNDVARRVKPPKWDSLFKGPNDKSAKMVAAVEEWYKSDWDDADAYEAVD